MTEETIDWKEIGNRAFLDKKYEDAITAYTAGLKITPSDIALLSNRSINYLCLELFSLALTDADAVLKIEPNHVKGIYRKVKALIGGKKYSQAVEFILKENYKDLLNEYTPEKNLGDKLLNQAMELINQETHGTYNMAKILTERTFEHEIADFNVPIAIEVFKGRGRGLVVKEKIEAGQLVIGSKAYAFIIERKNRQIKTDLPAEGTQPPPPEGGLWEEENYFVDKAVAKASLVQAITEKIKKYPEQTQIMYNLHAGRKLGHLELDESLNSSDTERISKIVDCNALCADGRVAFGCKELMYGLWLLPSFINHSCFNGNVKWNMHGDFLSIRAIKDIEPGEELLMSYVSPIESLDTRMESLTSYEVLCSCQLCELQHSETRETREKVTSTLKRYEVLITAPGGMISTETAELESIVSELEGIHPQNHHLCPFLFEPYRLLARKYFRKEDYEKSLNFLEKGYKLVIGTDFTEILVTFTTNIISSYLKNRNKSKAIEWVKILKSNIKACYGEPVAEVLQIIAPDLMMKFKKEKIQFA